MKTMKIANKLSGYIVPHTANPLVIQYLLKNLNKVFNNERFSDIILIYPSHAYPLTCVLAYSGEALHLGSGSVIKCNSEFAERFSKVCPLVKCQRFDDLVRNEYLLRKGLIPKLLELLSNEESVQVALMMVPPTAHDLLSAMVARHLAILIGEIGFSGNVAVLYSLNFVAAKGGNVRNVGIGKLIEVCLSIQEVNSNVRLSTCCGTCLNIAEAFTGIVHRGRESYIMPHNCVCSRVSSRCGITMYYILARVM